MSATWLYALGGVVLVSLISLIGVVSLAVNEQRLKQAFFVLISLATGALFGDAFIHLLPESYALSKGSLKTPVCVLAGLLSFFILEKFLRWRHEHLLPAESTIKSMGWLNLIADGLHNLLTACSLARPFWPVYQLASQRRLP